MCGIAVYWAKEAVLRRGQYKLLLEGALQRGGDGIGICVYSKSIIRFNKCIEINIEKILDWIEDEMFLNSVLMIICRATPETEKITTKKMLQPIFRDEIILIHNGGVTESIREEVTPEGYEYETDIDSEMIISSYLKFGKNMKESMEHLSGSFAFALLDVSKRKLYAVASFNPLAHMYIRGYGYFLHSDNEVLEEVLGQLSGASSDGMNVWESWYHHYIDGYTIIETDLDSGFQFKQEFVPRFLHPIWDALENEKKVKAFVSCSGGIDSGLTAFIFKKAGYDVTMVHFKCGQKAEKVELWAVEKQAEEYSCKLKIFDFKDFYKNIDDKSMLTHDDIPIVTGGDLLKSTIAWQAGRNVLFATTIMTLAEAEILRGECDEAIICGGWAQLSEECGGYPDNSFQFANALESIAKYGFITGSRMHLYSVMRNVTKTEEWYLGDKLGFPFALTSSCDNPKMLDDKPILCMECGSTKLSMLAADRAGVEDPRKFNGERKKVSEEMSGLDVVNIISRLMLSESEKQCLVEVCK